MKILKITLLFALILTPVIGSAKIELRTPKTPYKTKNIKSNFSILSIDNNTPATPNQTIGNNNSNYYRQYKPTSTINQNISYNNHITIESNFNDNTPFNEDAIVNTAPKQYAFGPPDKGPIGDVIWPLLIFVGIYLIKLRIKS